MIKRKRNRFGIIFLLIPWSAGAQQFRHTCMIDSVKESGFYSIPVSPDISAYLKTDFSDIRIVNEKGQWIPHIINYPYNNKSHEFAYFDLPIIKKENANSQTTIIVGNNGNHDLSDLFINVKNAIVNRFASLSGSDDQLKWFTIRDSILLKDTELILDNQPALKIYFPPVNYPYFRIIIFNGKNDPLNIQKVMNDGPPLPEKDEQYISNPKAGFIQSDSSGYSLIRIENKNNFHVSRININIPSPKYFERKASLYTAYAGSIKGMRQANPVAELTLSSNSTGDYNLPLLKSRVFYLLLENKDNPPLQMATITTEQGNKEIIAYLEKGKSYRLLFDDSLAMAPDYDLKSFVRNTIGKLNVGEISAANQTTIKVAAGKNKNRWIWPSIILVIVLLGFFTLSLTREIKKTNNNSGIE